jgi:hypothetical protein
VIAAAVWDNVLVFERNGGRYEAVWKWLSRKRTTFNLSFAFAAVEIGIVMKWKHNGGTHILGVQIENEEYIPALIVLFVCGYFALESLAVYAKRSKSGHIGKVTEFRPGPRGDGSDDEYTIETLVEGKFDPRFTHGVPVLGWDADGWPNNFLDAKAADKQRQKEEEKSPFWWPTLEKHKVKLVLKGDSDFRRYSGYLSAEDAMKLVSAPRCGSAGKDCSYCEYLARRRRQSPGDPLKIPKATHFVSFAYKYDFVKLVETLREFVDASIPSPTLLPLDDEEAVIQESTPHYAESSIVFWYTSASINQHDAARGKFGGDWFRFFSESRQDDANSMLHVLYELTLFALKFLS